MIVDSNILVYSINKSSPKHKKAQEFLLKNIGKLEVAHQNILEPFRILTHSKYEERMTANDATEAIEIALKGCKVISPDYKTCYITLELVKKYQLKSDQIFDAYLTATALSNGINTIATDNVRDFKKYHEIKVYNPFTQ